MHHIHQLLNEINLFYFTNIHLFQNFSADYELSPKQCAEVVAYTQLVKDKLVPALEFVWWVDSKNFVEFSRPTYANCLPFPLNVSIKAPISRFVVGFNHQICLFPTIFQFYYPGQYENRAKELIAALYKEEEDYEVIETAVRFNATFENCIYQVIILPLQVYKQAMECITMLSVKLGDKEFFYGQTPCSLDAVVFAHLAPLLKAPLPSAALQNNLKACTNLNRFVSRILQRYFSKDVQGKTIDA